jgi:TolA-binding protein
MKKFILLLLPILILAGCSSKKDTDYKEEGDKQKKAGNISAAITSYESLIKEFPDSKLTPGAMAEIANFYQENKVKNVGSRESLEKAAKMFREVYDKYPVSPEAPKALFTSAFILANQLGKFAEATESYKLFIAKFPHHDLTDDAQLELDVMGLSPEEIISRKHSKPGA